MKFLIIRFSSIGDIVLTTPVPRCLKKQIATAEIHYLTKKSFAPVLAGNPYIDKLHVIENEPDEIAATLRAEDFDYIIDLHHNLRSLKVKKQLKKQAFSFNKLNIEKWLLTVLKINRLPDTHIVDRYMQALESFGVVNDGAGLDYFIPKEEEIMENDIPTSHKAGYIGLVIGAAHRTKQYPLSKLKEFCDTINHPVIVLGGKEDAVEGEQLAAIDPFKIYNACGKFSINESADLVSRAKLIITNDTGLMHIAAAFKRPVVSLWGNTIPEFGMYPYYGKNYLQATSQDKPANWQPYEIMETKGVSCRPCSKIGYNKCPKGHFKCMQQIEVGSLLLAVQKRIRG
jgi:ADP-heptose:LPS heptosyltransferase